MSEFKDNKLYDIQIPEIKSVKLRPYQIEGISWVNFLFKYNLSGALCDDMGLGKTLQSLMTILIDYLKFPKHKYLIVCPHSLVKHWANEAAKHYQGYKIVHTELDKKFDGNWAKYPKTNVFIIGDRHLVRKSHFFSKISFHMCILDEAHLIKNEKSKLAQCVKAINVKHKLALTGTPIQNNLLELWSIFDFLMPQYLGSKEEFKKEFKKLFNLNLINMEASDIGLDTNQNKDLEMLHKRVLPFIMRRLKSQVLEDLPPKIIQDYYCEMTEVQQAVYDTFENLDMKNVKNSIDEMTGEGTGNTTGAKKSIPLLKSLVNLRKICNHPCQADKSYLTDLS